MERKTDSSFANCPAHALWCVGLEFVNAVQGKAFAGPGQKCGHPWQWGHVDVIPTGGHLLVGETKAEGPARRGEVARPRRSLLVRAAGMRHRTRTVPFELGGITVGRRDQPRIGMLA